RTAAPPGLRGRAPGGARHRSAGERPGRLSLANRGADRRGPLLDLVGRRDDPVQGGGVRLDVERGPAPAGVGRSGGAQPWQRPSRADRPLPAAAPSGVDGLPVRTPGERARDSALRGGRNAVSPHVSQLAVLTSLILGRGLTCPNGWCVTTGSALHS